MSDNAARAHFAARHIEKQFHVGARGKRMRHENKCSADAQLLDIRGVALSGALPGYQQAFGRPVPRMAAAFVF
jgi:hypothetical protein